MNETVTTGFVPDLTKLHSNKELRAWVLWQDDIELELRYISRTNLAKLSRECTLAGIYNPKTKQRESKVDPKKLVPAFVEKTLVGWKGLTVRKASKLIELDVENLTKEQLDTPVPFSKEQAIFLMENCLDLDSFLQETVQDLKVFNPTHEEEAGNSEASQNGS